MMRVAVLEDEPLALSSVVARIAAAEGVVLAGAYADGESALAGLSQQPADLLFLDVQLPGLSGLEVLASLPAAQRPMAILLTAYDHFAVRSFELNALDYLLKPIDDERFSEALCRARDILAFRRWKSPPALASEHSPQWETRFSVRLGRRNLFVDAAEVDWIEADGDYVVMHVGDRNFLLRDSLQRLHERLDPAHFVRVHRSAIVRIDQVAEWQTLSNRDAMLRLRNGTPVRASRTYIDHLLSRLR